MEERRKAQKGKDAEYRENLNKTEAKENNGSLRDAKR